MTTLSTFLENFGTPAPTSRRAAVSDEMLETERLEAFDTGYRAGWDDAIKAKEEDVAHVSEGLAQNLQDLSFTYHEVHAQILANLTPLFEEILQKMLPVLARDTLGGHVVDQLSQIARDMGTTQVEISVATGAVDQVSHLVNAASCSLPVTVTEAPLLSEGQAELRLGGKEMSIDLPDVSRQITDAVHAVLYDQTERRAHG